MLRNTHHHIRSAFQSPLDYGLAIVWFAFPVVGLLAPKGLFIVALVLFVLIVPNHLKSRPRRTTALVVGLALLLPLYALISAPLSPVDIEQAVKRSLRLSLELGIASLVIWACTAMSAQRAHIAVISFMAGCLVIAIAVIGIASSTRLEFLMKYWHISNDMGNLVSRGITIMALLIVPLAQWIFFQFGEQRYRSKQYSDAWLYLIIFIILISGKTTSLLAVIFGTLTLIATYLTKWARTVVFMCFCLITVTLPIVTASSFLSDAVCALASGQRSLSHRDVIWKFATEKIEERPIFGWGMDSSRSMPGAERMVPIPKCNTVDHREPLEQIMPLHPHNGALQVWLELGFVGVAISLGVLMAGLSKAFKLFKAREARATLTAHFVSLGLLVFMSFGIWQGWWLATITLAISLTIIICRSLEPKTKQGTLDAQDPGSAPEKPSEAY